MKKLLLASLILGGLAWWYWGRTLEPVNVIRAQLVAIEHHDYAKAYSYLSPKGKATFSEGQLRVLSENNRVIMKPLHTTFLHRTIDKNLATIQGTVEGMNGELSDAQYVLVNDGDTWRIESLQWSAPYRASDPNRKLREGHTPADTAVSSDR
jgi:hypothetical protein